MKQFLVPLVLVAATSAVAAPEYRPLPIEQREAAPSGVEYPQAGQYVPPAQTPQNPSATPAPQPSQPAVPSNVQWELYNQLQQLQQEMSELRGMVEQQAYQINQLKDQQRQRYLDLDHRINQLKSSPASATTEQPADSQSAVPAASANFDDKKAYNDAIALMRERKFKDAIGLLEQVVEKAPQSEYLPNAQYWLGELYMALTPPDYETAKKHLITLLKDFKDHQKIPDALYKLGMLYNLQGEKTKARVTLEKVIADYPTRQAAKLAKQLLTQL
ncbi:MAG: tol-pal system protein YbgF [Ketobacteraceae bacterium]|nr:tol-pal system protein YbgF [Ketobacteraceae bacterium]